MCINICICQCVCVCHLFLFLNCCLMVVNHLFISKCVSLNKLFQVTIPAGLVLCGWGKGKFREASRDKPLRPECEVTFDAKPDTLGVLDGKFGTFADFLNQAKEAKPDNVRFCYHTSAQEPDGEWKITQERTSQKDVMVYFFTI